MQHKKFFIPTIFFVLFAVLFYSLFNINTVYAHQPRITYDQEISLENPVEIFNPEISQAFYGNLKNDADYYVINSDQSFELYLSILVPDLENSTTDFIIEVIHEQEQIIKLDGNDFEWTKFYEEFGGDHYLDGPEITINVEPGQYLIKVSNNNNQGKYSLAVGKKEDFPADEAWRTLKVLPKLKTDFFDKPAYTAYINVIGLFLLAGLIIIIGIIIIIIFYLIKKLK